MKAVYEMPRVYFEAFAPNEAVAGTCNSGGGTIIRNEMYDRMTCKTIIEAPKIFGMKICQHDPNSQKDASADTFDFSAWEEGSYVVGMTDAQAVGYSSESSSVWCSGQDDSSKTPSYDDMGYWTRSNHS